MDVRFCPSCLAAVRATSEDCDSCRYERPDAGWPEDPHIGRIVDDKYRINAKLGQGGFGVVLRARHVQREHDFGDVVLKFLQPNLASVPNVRRRFVNEARAARALASPHVVKVFDFDFDQGGAPYMVMEYLEGRSLRELLHDEAPLDAARALRIGAQVASALEECHAAGIVHRDLKPSNIVVTSGPRGEDFAKLLDFGIAQLPDVSLSLSLVGTPKYMAPEQIEQQGASGAVDVFALGVILFECLAAQPPIIVRQSIKYLRANVDQAPLRLRALRPALPRALDNLLDAMMAKEPAARPSSARLAARLCALAEQLEGLRVGGAAAPSVAEPTATLPPASGSRCATVAPESLPGETRTSAAHRGSRAVLFVTIALSTLAIVCTAAAALLDGAAPRQLAPVSVKNEAKGQRASRRRDAERAAPDLLNEAPTKAPREARSEQEAVAHRVSRPLKRRRRERLASKRVARTAQRAKRTRRTAALPSRATRRPAAPSSIAADTPHDHSDPFAKVPGGL